MYYNPIDKFYKSIIGAVPTGKKVTFRVKGNFDSVLLLVEKDGDNACKEFALTKVNDYFEVKVEFLEGLYFYCFKISENNYIGKSKDYFGIIMGEHIVY